MDIIQKTLFTIIVGLLSFMIFAGISKSLTNKDKLDYLEENCKITSAEHYYGKIKVTWSCDE